MDLNIGDVLYIYSRFAKPIPKYKYAICVCNKKYLFFLINTSPRKFVPQSQILIKTEELPYLKWDSYIDTSKFVRYYPSEIKSADNKGDLPNHIKYRIKKVANKHHYLTINQQKIIETSFSLFLNNIDNSTSSKKKT